MVTTSDETTKPRIFITVQRLVGGQQTPVIKEISLETFLLARFPGEIITSEIHAMLREIGYG
jgi:hypothetical protein